jgi:alpha/beta hydrolase family protein
LTSAIACCIQPFLDDRYGVNPIMKRSISVVGLTATFLMLFCASAQGRVSRIQITSRTDFAGGKQFGAAGTYEQLVGKVFFEVDPNDPHNRIIVDLDKAPRNENGLVEFSSDLCILKPRDSSRGNGAALLEVPNRGGRALVRFFNHARGRADSVEGEAGDGFLMTHGFTLVWVGWQFDVPSRDGLLRLFAPIATENGKVITGLVRSDFVFSERVLDASLGHRGQNAQAAADPDSNESQLTVRDSVLGTRKPIPRSSWQFARVVNGQPIPDPTYIYLSGGFEPGKIYEVVYRAKNPTVVGLGLAAIRDTVSYLKYASDPTLNVSRAYGFGISQSGRFLRHFLYQGFNADEKNRKVFDGVDAHVAGAGRGSFNHRFAEPSRDASEFSTFFFPTDIFPFTDVQETDPETGEKDGLLAHLDSRFLPRIFYTFSSYEYWGRAASLIHTTADGKADAPMMENVRIYFFAGGQHGPAAFPPQKTSTRQAASPNDYTWSMRALLLALDHWVKDGAAPPASRYPHLSDGTLVRPQAVKFPNIPGVEFSRSIHEAYRVDYGPQFKLGIVSLEPPRVGKAFTMCVPQVDSDGIDLGGIRMPEVAVPLATYTGWNLREPKTGAPNELVDFAGSYILFPRTAAERKKSGDPRPSIEERYRGREDYLSRVKDAALKLVREGYLVGDDVAVLVERASRYWDHAMQ